MFDFILNRVHHEISHDKNFPQRLYKKIADLYDSIKIVKFRQHIILNCKPILQTVFKLEIVQGKELSIKPYHIGNTVGACAWCISQEKRNLLYLVTYNHANERLRLLMFYN